MANTVLKVGGMSCGHCVKAVKEAVTALPGVAGAEVDLAAKTVTIEHNPAETDVARLKAAIADQGYEILGG